MSTPRQFCTFHVDGLFFGIDVLQVQEVLRFQPMTRVPMAPAMVRGLINLRGQIVTAIDLRHRLGLASRGADSLPMNIVVRSEEGAVSLLADQIGDVIEISDDSFERPPDTLKGAARELVTGVHKLKDRLLLILDTGRAVSVAQGMVAAEA